MWGKGGRVWKKIGERKTFERGKKKNLVIITVTVTVII